MGQRCALCSMRRMQQPYPDPCMAWAAWTARGHTSAGQNSYSVWRGAPEGRADVSTTWWCIAFCRTITSNAACANCGCGTPACACGQWLDGQLAVQPSDLGPNSSRAVTRVAECQELLGMLKLCMAMGRTAMFCFMRQGLDISDCLPLMFSSCSSLTGSMFAPAQTVYSLRGLKQHCMRLVLQCRLLIAGGCEKDEAEQCRAAHLPCG